jgi:hypothetical protein
MEREVDEASADATVKDDSVLEKPAEPAAANPTSDSEKK